MKLQFPQSATKFISDNSIAEIKTLHGYSVIVVDNENYMDYNLFSYNEFCKDAGYCNYTDMLPEIMKEEYIHTNESLLAYAYYNKGLWTNIQDTIKIYYDIIAKLNNLRGEL